MARDPRSDRPTDTTDGTAFRPPGTLVESSSDRKALAAHAGVGRVSLLSVLAGTVAAFGTVTVVGSVAAAGARAAGLEAPSTEAGWQDVGVAGAAIGGVVLALSWLFGGYVAGRMARRAGATHGLLAVVLGAALSIVVGTALAADSTAVADGIARIDTPVAGADWLQVATVAGLIALLAVVGGAIAGGVAGERWHTRLLERALDPDVGGEARAYDAVQDTRAELSERQDQVGQVKADATERVQRARGAGTTEAIDLTDPTGPREADRLSGSPETSGTAGPTADTAPTPKRTRTR